VNQFGSYYIVHSKSAALRAMFPNSFISLFVSFQFSFLYNEMCSASTEN